MTIFLWSVSSKKHLATLLQQMLHACCYLGRTKVFTKQEQNVKEVSITRINVIEKWTLIWNIKVTIFLWSVSSKKTWQHCISRCCMLVVTLVLKEPRYSPSKKTTWRKCNFTHPPNPGRQMSVLQFATLSVNIAWTWQSDKHYCDSFCELLHFAL